MDWNRGIRQAHRWLSVAFTVTVLVNVVLNILARQQKITLWVGLLTLLPLGLLFITGLYLFAEPYATKGRSRRRTD